MEIFAEYFCFTLGLFIQTVLATGLGYLVLHGHAASKTTASVVSVQVERIFWVSTFIAAAFDYGVWSTP